ncbi:O-acetyl-ADP-ribose deacetylase [Promicromonospora citrea]|uniref:O-acetyl-ADP-ribose deacetylase n=1 Tax=Promicromonospora citrea TaxID=43677 RepID=A0A8H9L2P1_9MICO|nr:O-acetyl-ADP-ribose deacetylase [Promicromonospora citrea]NNH53749.1 O-acetyl-ADP-ribose deacetylase [Promicromonospora citrea]GGM23204.1 O-acetyl-ADP-ribose deacetylase [Promicromonospora citrea]
MSTLTVEVGDLTRVEADAVVNAANSTLLGGGGVDGALHAAAGPRLLEACRRLRATTHPDGLAVGDAVATPAFDLPASWVIHTVGPNLHRGQDDPALLGSCFTRSLDVAALLDVRSVAFPAVSGGAYGWPMTDVARIAVAACRAWLAGHPDGSPREVRFVVRDERSRAVFETALGDPGLNS